MWTKSFALAAQSSSFEELLETVKLRGRVNFRSDGVGEDDFSDDSYDRDVIKVLVERAFVERTPSSIELFNAIFNFEGDRSTQTVRRIIEHAIAVKSTQLLSTCYCVVYCTDRIESLFRSIFYGTSFSAGEVLLLLQCIDFSGGDYVSPGLLLACAKAYRFSKGVFSELFTILLRQEGITVSALLLVANYNQSLASIFIDNDDLDGIEFLCQKAELSRGEVIVRCYGHVLLGKSNSSRKNINVVFDCRDSENACMSVELLVSGFVYSGGKKGDLNYALSKGRLEIAKYLHQRNGVSSGVPFFSALASFDVETMRWTLELSSWHIDENGCLCFASDTRTPLVQVTNDVLEFSHVLYPLSPEERSAKILQVLRYLSEVFDFRGQRRGISIFSLYIALKLCCLEVVDFLLELNKDTQLLDLDDERIYSKTSLSKAMISFPDALKQLIRAGARTFSLEHLSDLAANVHLDPAVFFAIVDFIEVFGVGEGKIITPYIQIANDVHNYPLLRVLLRHGFRQVVQEKFVVESYLYFCSDSLVFPLECSESSARAHEEIGETRCAEIIEQAFFVTSLTTTLLLECERGYFKEELVVLRAKSAH
ncbi:MAG: hypothetical protein BVN35_20015 [Proteobacteria bacterium ST_bin11]|nr:MAG: hypothetical protein BVN35_20015 [Proteobacteria bacterium ST_bin11]